MTLDELIERLQILKSDYPAAGTAMVRIPGQSDLRPQYSGGEVIIGQEKGRGPGWGA